MPVTAQPPRRPARAEVVGSLLRPQRLLEARAAGGAALEGIVDAEVRTAVARQVDVGLDVVTDGEFGRAAFTHSFYDAIEGIEPNPVPVEFDTVIESGTGAWKVKQGS